MSHATASAVDAVPAPFAAFAPPIRPQSALRQAITAAYRRPEPACLPPLVAAARLPSASKQAVAATARLFPGFTIDVPLDLSVGSDAAKGP